jgi:hypothetical protein
LDARVSADLKAGDTVQQPFGMIGVGHEFEGTNPTTMSSSSSSSTGGSLTIDDAAIGTYGEASLGLNIFRSSGSSGFIKGNTLFTSHATGGVFRLGVRYEIGD